MMIRKCLAVVLMVMVMMTMAVMRVDKIFIIKFLSFGIYDL